MNIGIYIFLKIIHITHIRFTCRLILLFFSFNFTFFQVNLHFFLHIAYYTMPRMKNCQIFIQLHFPNMVSNKYILTLSFNLSQTRFLLSGWESISIDLTQCLHWQACSSLKMWAPLCSSNIISYISWCIQCSIMSIFTQVLGGVELLFWQE